MQGAKAVHPLAGGDQIFVVCLKGSERPELLRKAGGLDPRTVAKVAESNGRSESSLKDVVGLCSEVPSAWSLSGPRTA